MLNNLFIDLRCVYILQSVKIVIYVNVNVNVNIEFINAK